MTSRDFLQRVADRVSEQGGAAETGDLAAEFLRVPDGPLARRTFCALLSADPRFLISIGQIHLQEWDHGLRGKRLEDLTFAVLDFETNGFAPVDRAIEIGISCWRGGREVSSFESLLDSGTGVSRFVTRLTGIREEDLIGRPTFEAVLPEVAPLLEGAVVVAHNLPFDRRILLGEIGLAGGDRRLAEPGICTLKLARRLLPKDEPKRLDALAERFSLSFQARHRALGDARVTGSLLQLLLELASERTPLDTLGDLEAFLSAPVERSCRHSAVVGFDSATPEG
jgi:DNA polymerase-3 subunit epsilon